ncbi:alpha/beta hydrolase [Rhodococcus sp. ABRD24]|uniref:alpha/beta fold hydrolase n=1 Tax=Rhodococcus sp. ABRD24 TaxID=2507582 RepID=UPI001F625458|nr:alpha/beta hydrolase [Rhodococcus sp. ABRD24]
MRRRLAERGHTIFTPTLAGCAERFDANNHAVTLRTHINEIAGMLRFEDLDNVVVVGHSYAGTLLESIAALEPERVRHLINLDGHILDPGQRAYDFWSSEQVDEALTSTEAGHPFRKPHPPETLGITDPAQRRWVSARLTPHPLGCYRESVPPETIPSTTAARTYVRCMAGPITHMFDVHAVRARERGWSVSEIDAPHDAMITHPDVLADQLADIASQAMAHPGHR